MLFFYDRFCLGVCRDLFGVGSAVQAGTSLAGAGIQAAAANNATNAQKEIANNNLAFQKQVYGDQQTKAQPYYSAGTNALGTLSNQVSPGGSLSGDNAPQLGIYGGQAGGWQSGYVPIWGDKSPAQIAPNFSFTGQDLKNDPGYQFTLDQGLQAQQREAAATGATGGAAAKAIAQYTTGLADTTFNNAYQRAANTFGVNSQQQNINANQYLANNQNLNNQDMNLFNTRLNEANFNQGVLNNLYNTQQQNQSNTYNRLASLAGVGQTATNQLASAGNSAAQNYGNTSAQLGNAISAGSIASGNAIANGINGAGNAFNNYAIYKSVYGG